MVKGEFVELSSDAERTVATEFGPVRTPETSNQKGGVISPCVIELIQFF
jgi:hypothetical protein